MTHYTRKQWGARARLGRTKLDAGRVIGIALHWPATTTRYQSVKGVMAGLRSWQTYHMDTHGWSDIAYQIAVDQEGNSYVLRGLRTRSGANGDTNVNEAYGAILLVLAMDETPTAAMIATVRDQVAKHRKIFTHSTRIVGHQDIRPEPTSCPGAVVMRLIETGAFNPKESK